MFNRDDYAHVRKMTLGVEMTPPDMKTHTRRLGSLFQQEVALDESGRLRRFYRESHGVPRTSRTQISAKSDVW